MYSKAVNVFALTLNVLSLTEASFSRRFAFISSSSIQTRRFYSSDIDQSETENLEDDSHIASMKSPWSHHKDEVARSGAKSVINKSRFRQHVNPLARLYQMETELNVDWPDDGTYSDPSRPLHVDIGCGKGGFLLELAERARENPGEIEARNYLGLEIRPSVALYAKERVEKHRLSGSLDFIGCNANVDLDRILKQYQRFGGEVRYASIQFPDPHFKKHHQKRRVVTESLVKSLAANMKQGGQVFIQSDIKDVLDNMRMTIHEFGGIWFSDQYDSLEQYIEENPIGVATEREVSVLNQGLPVYRALFTRNEVTYSDKSTQ